MCSLTIECGAHWCRVYVAALARHGVEYMLWTMLRFAQEPYLHVPYLQVPNLQARHLVYVSRDRCHVIGVT